MNVENNLFVYQSIEPFSTERLRAAAVYCSDGRFGNQFDDFMQNALGLPRYDRIALPGGAACLASHFVAYREEEGAAEQVRFLVEVHQLERIVLIAHENCAFYTHRLNISSLQLKSQQLEDLRKAASRVRLLGRHLQIEAYFARLDRKNMISFERVDT